MGKLYKESYANTFAAVNVRYALEKLINVLQTPHERRHLSIRTGAAAAAAARERAKNTVPPNSGPVDTAVVSTNPTCSGNSTSGSNSSTRTPGTASLEDHTTSSGSTASIDESVCESSEAGRRNLKDDRSSESSRSSKEFSRTRLKKKIVISNPTPDSIAINFTGHIPPLLHDKMWKRSLRSSDPGKLPRIPPHPSTVQGTVTNMLRPLTSDSAQWSATPCKYWNSPL